MTEKPYTYSVIRYIHDLTAEERLNVGVVLHCPAEGFVGLKYSRSYRRLSSSFRDFDPKLFWQVMLNLERSINSLNRQDVLFPLSDSLAVINYIWPDYALNYRGTPAKPGLAKEPLDEVLNKLYDRFVTNQMPDKREVKSRSDDDIWKKFRNQMKTRTVLESLEPEVINARSVPFKFDHTYKNGHLHVVAPLSFDLMDVDSIRDKAMRWLGNGEVLKEVPDIGKFFFLIGPPRYKERLPAFDAAMEWIDGIKLDKQFFYEDRPEDLADAIERLVGRA